MRKRKPEIITFKVDKSLADAMHGIGNRSEFIRTAVLAALDGICPLCQGAGALTPNQKKHWQDLADDHSVEKCDDCDEFHLVCQHEGGAGEGP